MPPHDQALLARLPAKAAEAVWRGLAEENLRSDAADAAFAEAFQLVGFPKNPPLPASELTPEQRTLAELFTDRHIYTSGFGMPTPAWATRRWLGLEAQGVLEELVSFEHEGRSLRAPLWRALALLLDADFPAAQRLVEALPLEKRLRFFGELYAHNEDMPYGLRPATLVAECRDGFLNALGDQCGAYAAEYLGHMVELTARSGGKIRQEPGAVFFPAAVRGKVAIDPRWDQFLPCWAATAEIVAECARAIPEERRAKAVIGAMQRDPSPFALRSALRVLREFPSIELVDATFDRAIRDNAPKMSDLERMLEELGDQPPNVQERVAARLAQWKETLASAKKSKTVAKPSAKPKAAAAKKPKSKKN